MNIRPSRVSFISVSTPCLWLLFLIALGGGTHGFAFSAPVDSLISHDNVVLRWNHAMLDAIRTETTPPPLAARNLAILHLAIEDATRLDPASGREDAVEAAALVVCEALFPGQAGSFRIVGNSPARLVRPASAAEVKGETIARRRLSEREGDGASRSVTYIPETQQGRWRRTAPFFRPPELPQWPLVRTFGTDLDALPALSGPPALDTPEFASARAEVDRLGRSDSPGRTAEQTLIARFWSDFSYTATPPGHWNLIAAQVARNRSLDATQSAMLFARLNVAMADAGIACWRAKYTFNAWRPITALNVGSASSASSTSAQPAWRPLLPTPSHPEYPSGHSAFSGAAAAVLAAFIGTDECTFSVTSDAVPGVTRTFRRFSEAAEEISLSRVYCGIHFGYGCRDGLILGRAVGQMINRRAELAPPSSTVPAP